MKQTLVRLGDGLFVAFALVVGTLAVVKIFRSTETSTAAEPRPIQVVNLPSGIGTGRLVLGRPSARVRLVEFADFECPACAMADSGLRALRRRFPDDLAIVFRHLPLEQHPNAIAAATASECASEQGKFERYHDLLFRRHRSLATAPWVKWAAEVGVRDTAVFRNCLADSTISRRIQEDVSMAAAVGANATPSFVLDSLLLVGVSPFRRDELVATAVAAVRRKVPDR